MMQLRLKITCWRGVKNLALPFYRINMKLNLFLKLTCLLAGLLLISAGNASAQWQGGGTNTLNDKIVFSGNTVIITGTLVATDPVAIYSPPAIFNIPGVLPGYAHYYQLTTPITTEAPLPSIFYIYDYFFYWPQYTILDSNLNILSNPTNSILDLTSGFGSLTNTFPLKSGSTYYIEASSYDFGVGPFTFQITNNINTLIQVNQGTSGVATGTNTLVGTLTGSDEPSHKRLGAYADFYRLIGTGTATLTMSGLDTYLYVYNSAFKLIGSNDVSNPPGAGGSRVKVLLTGTSYVEATSYAKGITGFYTLTTSKGGLTQIFSPWDTSGLSSVNAVPIAYTASGILSKSSLSHARSGRYANYYQVQVSNPGATSITVSGFDSYVYVYDPFKKVIASNDDSNPPGGGGSRVSVNLSAGNTYIIEVTSYFPAILAQYTLTVASKTSSGLVQPVGNPF